MVNLLVVTRIISHLGCLVYSLVSFHFNRGVSSVFLFRLFPTSFFSSVFFVKIKFSVRDEIRRMAMSFRNLNNLDETIDHFGALR